MELNSLERRYGITGLPELDVKIMSDLRLIDIENMINIDTYLRNLFIDEMETIIPVITKYSDNFDLVTFTNNLFWSQNFDVLAKLIAIAHLFNKEDLNYDYLYEFLCDELLIFYLKRNNRDSYENSYYLYGKVGNGYFKKYSDEDINENRDEDENKNLISDKSNENFRLNLLGFLLSQNDMYLEKFIEVLKERFHDYYGGDKGKKLTNLLNDITKLAIYQNLDLIMLINYITNSINEEFDNLNDTIDYYREEETNRYSYEREMMGY